MNAAAFLIRRAEAADAERVAPLFDAYRVFYGQRSDLPASRAFLTERLAGDDAQIFLAESDGAAVGFVQLFPIFVTHTARCGRCWLLNDLYVAESSRRRGVGRALLERAERLARESGAEGLTLSTGIDNLRAQRLYESMGYRRDGRFSTYNRSL